MDIVENRGARWQLLFRATRSLLRVGVCCWASPLGLGLPEALPLLRNRLAGGDCGPMPTILQDGSLTVRIAPNPYCKIPNSVNQPGQISNHDWTVLLRQCKAEPGCEEED